MGRKRENLKQIISLADDIRIVKVDEMNWVVQARWWNKKKARHEWVNKTYHAEPAQAMRSIVNNMPVEENLIHDLDQFQQWYADRISRMERLALDAVGG